MDATYDSPSSMQAISPLCVTRLNQGRFGDHLVHLPPIWVCLVRRCQMKKGTSMHICGKDEVRRSCWLYSEWWCTLEYMKISITTSGGGTFYVLCHLSSDIPPTDCGRIHPLLFLHVFALLWCAAAHTHRHNNMCFVVACQKIIMNLDTTNQLTKIPNNHEINYPPPVCVGR